MIWTLIIAIFLLAAFVTGYYAGMSHGWSEGYIFGFEDGTRIAKRERKHE